MTNQPTTNTTREATDVLAQMSPAAQRELLAKLLREKAERSKTFPMSAGQQGLWHAFRREPSDTAFNVFLPTRFRSSINVVALRQAIEHLAKRHSSLRATFSDDGGELCQRIQDDLRPEFTVVELLGADEQRVRAMISQAVLRPFDLSKGPLLRVTVYKLANDDWIILALTHHIVVDFWSLVIIMRELRTAYPAFASGVQPMLPVARNNYAEFVAEQRALLDNSRGEGLRDFWLRTLEGPSPVVELPLDRIRPTHFTHRAAVSALRFEASVVSRISRFAARNRATTFAVVQAALQVLISRYSGQDSFFIGSPFSGRNHQKFEDTVGFFINILPLKADLEGDPCFSNLVKRATVTLLDALEHEAYPISKIVNDASIPRDPSRSPLFQVSCTFEKAHLKEESGRAGFLFPEESQVLDFGGLKQESFFVPHPTCHYDLEFIFEQTETELKGMICYCKDLFDEPTVEKMAKNFTTLLDSLLLTPDSPLSTVPWNMHPVGLSREGNLPISSSIDGANRDRQWATVDATIQSTSRANPTGLAMQSQHIKFSFEQLDAQSNLAAAYLVTQGIGQDSVVPVVGKPGPAIFAAMQAIHLAGAAFVPVDADQPAHDLRSLLSDTNAPLVIVDSPESLHQTDCPIPIVHFDECLAHGKAIDQQHLPTYRHHSVDNLAYIVYTSGSTGTPKGVMVEHAAVCNTLRWRAQNVTLHSNDRVLMLLSHQFDAGLGVAWTTLTQGAALIWADPEAKTDLNAIIEQIRRDRITVLPAVPSLLRILVEQPRFSECKSLRYIWMGGEAMPPELPEQIRNVSNAQCWNFYGPTEAAIEATAIDVTQHDPGLPVPIGKPIAGIRVLILDEHQREVPDTIPGEIAIGGAGLARGYLNQPVQTADKFVSHPSVPGSRSKIYLTGDRGRWNARGEVEFLGRTDHQVKLRGYRIELGEIEAVIDSHECVSRSAVRLDNQGAANAALFAFVSLDKNAMNEMPAAFRRHASAAIRRFVAERLPAYKVPAAIMIIESMPMTASGKVDRKKLPAVIPDELLQQQVIQPGTDIEIFLADAWCRILGFDNIGVNQNFFDAGGSSLQAAMLTTQLSEALNVHIPTALVFDLADISQLAVRLVQLHPGKMTERFGEHCVVQQLEQVAHIRRNTPNGHAVARHPLIAPLQTCGSKDPIFMVHPPGGIVVCYRELALELGEDRPLYGIRSKGLHGTEELPATLEAMAREYVAAIKTVQAKGPYTIGGWSLGGLVAYEIAQQLSAENEIVRGLILLDTTIPEGATDLVPASEQVNVGKEYGIDLTLDQLGDLAPEEQLPFLWEHAQKLGVLDQHSPPEVVARALDDLQGLFHHHVALARNYTLRETAAPIYLFRPTEVPFELNVTDDRGWKHLAQQVSVHFVPGHHHSMVQPPHARHLASSISRCLDELDR